MSLKPNQVIMDIEVYPNYWLIGFKNYKGGIKYFEKWNDSEIDPAAIERILAVAEIITFNGNGYDMPILTLALSGASNQTVKDASDAIIVEDLKPWDFYKRYKLKEPKWNHIDLNEPAPAVRISLKLYGGRLHTRTLQDLPVEPHEEIDESNHDLLVNYWKNDLQLTDDLYHAIEDRIDLRRSMTKQYGIDLRSKSDAQIAEVVIKKQVEEITGQKVRKSSPVRRTFNYSKPPYAKFSTEQLQKVLEFFETVEFVSEKNGVITSAEDPPTVSIGDTTFKLGLGGIHSQDSEVSHISNSDYAIWDFDVNYYYPAIFIQLGLFPDALGEPFVEVFKGIVDTRIQAKKDKNKLVDSSTKIMINGTFGKTGSVYSILFAPNLMIQTTVTGQICLLMLIERLSKYGIEVVSGNTDGIVMKVPRPYFETRLKPIVGAWEKLTGFGMEGTEYKSIHMRDVNNYIAIKPDGSVKTKGIFAPGGLQKSPTNDICAKAFIKYLTDGVAIEDTIRSCRDIRDFVSVRSVTGGAMKDGEYLGKAIRWYASTEVKGAIVYKRNGNKVPKTDGCRPLMTLPDEFPDDVDFDRYIKEANSYFYDVGLKPRPIPTKIPRKNTHAWKDMFANGEIVEFEDKFVHRNDLAWMT